MSRSDKKETKEIEKRIAKLEAEVKGGAPASGSRTHEGEIAVSEVFGADAS
ncbi:MAG: hypothetical protein ABSB94_19550 [Syntrophorhabdales bacterium]|jgi:hypothetical protein